MGRRTGLYVPLVAAAGALGVIAVHDKRGRDPRFSDGDLRLAEIFAAPGGRRRRLSERVARDTVRRVVAAQESERQRLALELHDETGQALTSILLGLRSIGRPSNDVEAEHAEAGVRELVVQALQDVRALAVELRPAALDDFGLGSGARAARRDVRRAQRHRDDRAGEPRAAPAARGRDHDLPASSRKL